MKTLQAAVQDAVSKSEFVHPRNTTSLIGVEERVEDAQKNDTVEAKTLLKKVGRLHSQRDAATMLW